MHVLQEEKLGNTIVAVDQERYVEDVLRNFNMEDCKPRRSILPERLTYRAAVKREEEQSDKEWREKVPYRELVGALLHLSRYTRPDIQFAVSYVARYCNCFSKENWVEVKHILRYLQQTKGAKLVYGGAVGDRRLGLYGYVDADWASDISDRVSVSGYVFMYGGGPVSWASRKQASPATSTLEAEYMAMSEAAQEAIYLRGLVEFVEYKGVELKPTAILCDNQGARQLVQNPYGHKRSKHIDIRYHFNRDAVAKGKVVFVGVATERNVADIFTKALGPIKIERFRKSMGIVLSEGELRECALRLLAPWELIERERKEARLKKERFTKEESGVK